MYDCKDVIMAMQIITIFWVAFDQLLGRDKIRFETYIVSSLLNMILDERRNSPRSPECSPWREIWATVSLILISHNIVHRHAPVRQHLKNVYGCLSLSTVSAAAGAYVHMYTQLLQANLLTTIGTLGLLFALLFTPDNGKNQKLRLSYLLGFAFLSGLGLGPLLEVVVSIDPSIVVTALVGKILPIFLVH